MMGLVDLAAGLLADLGAKNVTIGLTLIMATWYFWKGKKVAGILGGWSTRVIFTLAVIGILLLTGVLEGVNFQALADLVGTIVEVVSEIIEEVL